MKNHEMEILSSFLAAELSTLSAYLAVCERQIQFLQVNVAAMTDDESSKTFEKAGFDVSYLRNLRTKLSTCHDSIEFALSTLASMKGGLSSKSVGPYVDSLKRKMQ